MENISSRDNQTCTKGNDYSFEVGDVSDLSSEGAVSEVLKFPDESLTSDSATFEGFDISNQNQDVLDNSTIAAESNDLLKGDPINYVINDSLLINNRVDASTPIIDNCVKFVNSNKIHELSGLPPRDNSDINKNKKGKVSQVLLGAPSNDETITLKNGKDLFGEKVEQTSQKDKNEVEINETEKLFMNLFCKTIEKFQSELKVKLDVQSELINKKIEQQSQDMDDRLDRQMHYFEYKLLQQHTALQEQLQTALTQHTKEINKGFSEGSTLTCAKIAHINTLLSTQSETLSSLRDNFKKQVGECLSQIQIIETGMSDNNKQINILTEKLKSNKEEVLLEVGLISKQITGQCKDNNEMLLQELIAIEKEVKNQKVITNNLEKELSLSVDKFQKIEGAVQELQERGNSLNDKIIIQTQEQEVKMKEIDTRLGKVETNMEMVLGRVVTQLINANGQDFLNHNQEAGYRKGNIRNYDDVLQTLITPLKSGFSGNNSPGIPTHSTPPSRNFSVDPASYQDQVETNRVNQNSRSAIVDIIKKERRPHFNGDNLSAPQFLRELEDFLRLVGITSDVDRLQIFGTFLYGKPARWWELTSMNVTSWTMARQMFLDQYFTEFDLERYKKEWHDLNYQQTPDVERLALRGLQLQNILKAEDPIRKRCERVIVKMPEPLRDYLLNRSYSTTEEFLTGIKEAMRLKNFINGKFNSGSPKSYPNANQNNNNNDNNTNVNHNNSLFNNYFDENGYPIIPNPNYKGKPGNYDPYYKSNINNSRKPSPLPFHSPQCGNHQCGAPSLTYPHNSGSDSRQGFGNRQYSNKPGTNFSGAQGNLSTFGSHQNPNNHQSQNAQAYSMGMIGRSNHTGDGRRGIVRDHVYYPHPDGQVRSSNNGMTLNPAQLCTCYPKPTPSPTFVNCVQSLHSTGEGYDEQYYCTPQPCYSMDSGCQDSETSQNPQSNHSIDETKVKQLN